VVERQFKACVTYQARRRPVMRPTTKTRTQAPTIAVIQLPRSKNVVGMALPLQETETESWDGEKLLFASAVERGV